MQAQKMYVRALLWCVFRYLFNFRGIAASFRLKHLFLCRSLVFHVGEEWIEFFYPGLKPWYHYIPVSTSLDEAEDLLAFAAGNDEVVKKIADRGRDFIWSHLKMSDISSYWKSLLHSYASLLKYPIIKAAGYKEVTPKPADKHRRQEL